MRKLLISFYKKTAQVVNEQHTALFTKYLLLTNTVSSGFLMYIGEYFAQRIEKSRNFNENEYDKEKMKQLAVVGLSQGPLHHYTYLWMERLLPGNAKSTIVKKIMSDQFIVSPVFILHYFYTSYFLEGRKVTETNELLKDKFLKVYAADWLVWPATQFINFMFVPLQYRVLYINMITMFYNIFLCYVKNERKH
ncbi:mpv17-like protein 2 [Chironomus tepperi]|uniref:mpv17-like protein 2 n=1 Tax=Chironomus tepperi TaxID=113505 RepID=UPI00391EE81B